MEIYERLRLLEVSGCCDCHAQKPMHMEEEIKQQRWEQSDDVRL